ncbi:hypothetical protein UFOVP783_81 [uncultured Caudovirales phage]|uniref:Uncharacterized protein n=1 Tax=uncultured Caudovirales phage TaxID=2100421 RepID=A0A6J5P535_9CAUD|nr:hypothetical protein UFOVP783_81 [uncultured Caudovirales phage]
MSKAITKEMSRALYESFIPARYHTPSINMKDCGCPNAEQWSKWLLEGVAKLKEGGFMHMAGDGLPNMDRLFITARALVTNGVPTAVITLPSACMLIGEGKGGDWQELVEDRQVLVIPGFTGQQAKLPVDEKAAYRLEWFLRRWLLSGKGLITQGSTPLAGSPWWPASLVTTLQALTIPSPK